MNDETRTDHLRRYYSMTEFSQNAASWALAGLQQFGAYILQELRRYVYAAPIWPILALAVVLALAFQGSRGLFESTEGRYAEAAREMIETGSWLVPQLDYAPHWTKPPLTYWAIAGGMLLLGENEWGARFYNAVLFVLIVWIVIRLGTLLWDARVGFFAGLLYAVSPYAVYAANSVHTDLLLSLFELLVVFSYVKARAHSGTSGERRWIIALWVFAGLGFLTKGPPSFLVLFSLAAFQVYLKRTGRPRPRMLSVPGLACFAVLGLSWFGLVISQTPGLLSYFLGEEVVNRIFTPGFDRNPHWYSPVLIYGPPLLFGAGPVMVVWLILLKRHRASVRWTAFRQFFRDDERFAFFVLWLAIPVVMLSISQSRLPLYVLPFFPAVVLATARALTRFFDGPRLNRRLVVLTLIMAFVMLAAKAGLAYVPSSPDMRRFHRTCIRFVRGDTAFYVYESTKMYGLQFYLKGRLTRLWEKPPGKPGQLTIDALIEEAKTRPAHDIYVIVTTSSRNQKQLESRLQQSGLNWALPPHRGSYGTFVVNARSG